VLSSAQVIREARLKADLTQAELGERIGRDRAQIARWEISGQQPSFENLQAVVEACGFALKVQIVVPEQTPALDAELETSLLQAPQERVRALLDDPGRDA
jgi:transcriptional regulator with XRE-family HTH domain